MISDINSERFYTDGRSYGTQLESAIAMGQTGMVESLLQQGANPDKSTRSTGETPLQAAAVVNNIGMFTALLVAGANPKICKKSGENALDTVNKYSDDRSNASMKELLERRGVTPNIASR